jgi:hypothetical protein
MGSDDGGLKGICEDWSCGDGNIIMKLIQTTYLL